MKLVLSLCLLIGTAYASPFVQVSAEYDDVDTRIVKDGPYLYQIQHSPYGVSYSIQYNRPIYDEEQKQQIDNTPFSYGHGLFGVPDVSSSSEEQRFVPRLKLGLDATSSEDVKETTTKKSKSKSKVPKKPVSKFDKYKTSTVVPLDPITQINQIKDEYVLKRQQLWEEINDKIDALSTKAQTEYETLQSTDPTADTTALDTKYQQKYDDLQIKLNDKSESLLIKYQNKIDALKTPDMSDQQFNLLNPSFFDTIQSTTVVPVVAPVEDFGNFDFARADYDDAFQKTDYQTPFAHSLTFEHPSLRLGAVAASTPLVEATTKQPTVADVYWKSFGAKIKETFNKTKTMTTESTPVDATVIAGDGSIVPAVPTTPLPATFYKTFGKTIGKSFKDATAKIMAVVKSTTVAPTVAVDDLDTEGTVVAPAPTIEVDPAFWDDFGNQIEGVFKSKAVLDALKATTTASPTTGDLIDPALVNQQTIDLDYTPSDVPVDPSSPVTRKLKLGVGAVDDTVAPAVPVPTIPGIYWKTFGDKIKESFNKSKTVTTDSTVSADGVTPVPPTLPPTFWMSFGKSIATALNNAKFKLISATKPTPGPLITDPTATTAAPAVPIDAAFWDSFSKELDAAILAKAMLTTTVAPLTVDSAEQTTDDLQQLDDDTADLSPSKGKLYLAAGDDSTDTSAPSPVMPPSPGAYWKNYGGQIAGYFINAKGQLIPSVMVPPITSMGPYAPVAPVVPITAPVAPVAPVLPITAPVSPASYWKGYGDSMSGHFINAKGQILDTVSKIKPTFVPYIMPPFFGQTPYSTLNDDSQMTENVDPQETVSSFGTSSDEVNAPIYKQHKLQLSVGSAEDDDTDANPGVYWKNYGQDIKDNFIDAKYKIKNDVINSKFEQPIFTDDITDPTSIPEKQTTFWARFRQRIEDTVNRTKARMSEISG